VLQVVRTSNGYRFTDPLDSEPGRRVWCKSENRSRPQNRDLKKYGARLDGAQVIQDKLPQPPPLPTAELPAIALQREHDIAGQARLSPSERAAIVGRMDAGTATKADWLAWECELEAMVQTIG